MPVLGRSPCLISDKPADAVSPIPTRISRMRATGGATIWRPTRNMAARASLLRRFDAGGADNGDARRRTARQRPALGHYLVLATSPRPTRSPLREPPAPDACRPNVDVGEARADRSRSLRIRPSAMLPRTLRIVVRYGCSRRHLSSCLEALALRTARLCSNLQESAQRTRWVGDTLRNMGHRG